jgi:hypothetical protein
VIPVPRGDYDIIKIDGVLDLAGGSDGKVFNAGFQAAAGHLHVLASQRVENIRDRKIVGAQPLRVHDDANFTIGAALNLHLADAIAVLQPLLDLFVGDQCHIARGAGRSGNGDLENWHGIRIHFRYDGDLGARR